MEKSSKDKLNEVSSKSRAGFIFYTLRSIFLNFLQVISSLVLAKYLNGHDYGVFGVINGHLAFLIFSTDIGLSISLVQFPEKVNENILRTYFTIRIILSLALGIVFSFLVDDIISHYAISSQNQPYFKLLGFLPFLDILSCVPKVKFSIDLDYKKLGKADISGAVALYAVQISSALLGAGFWSFFLGVAARSVVVLIVCARHEKAFYRPLLDFRSVKPFAKVGVFHQLNMAIDGVKSICLPMILKLSLNVEQMGLIFWMEGLVSLPKIIAYNWNNVFYPSLSHLEDSESQFEFIRRNLEKIILILAIIFGLGGTLGSHLIDLVFDEKWFEAKTYIFFAAICILLKMSVFVLTSVLSGVKKPHLKFRIDFSSIFIDYILLLTLMKKGSVIEYFYASILGSFFSILFSLFYLREFIGPSSYRRILTSFLAAGSPYFLMEYFSVNKNIFMSLTLYLSISFTILFVGDPSSKSEVFRLLSQLLKRIKKE